MITNKAALLETVAFYHREKKKKKGDPIFGKFFPVPYNLEIQRNMAENIEF